MAIVEIRDLLDKDTGLPVFPRTHVDAVIGLKDNSFFELVQDSSDPTKFSVKLKSQYTGLWAEGFVASGGVGGGTSGGGGGGSVDYLNDIGDVYVPNPSNGNLLSWDSSTSQWVDVPRSAVGTPVTLVNGASYSTLTVSGTNAEFYTKAQTDALIGAIQQFHYEIYASTSAVTNPQGNVLYLIGPTGSGADKYEEYVYANSTWTKIGDTSIDLSGYVQKVSGAVAGNLAQFASGGGLVDSGYSFSEIGEVIMGTQTAATGSWTGVSKLATATDFKSGYRFSYWLPYAGSGNASLTLTFQDGTTKTINLYVGGSTRLTTHIGAGNHIDFLYLENANIGTTLYTGAWVDKSQDNNTYDRVCSAYERTYIHDTTTPLYRYKLCGYDVDGRLVPLTVTNQTSATMVDKTPTTVGFLANRGIVYYSTTTAITAATTATGGSVLYHEYPITACPYTFNDSVPTYRDVFLKGSYDHATGLFTLDTTTHTSWYVFAPKKTSDGNYNSVFTAGAYYIHVGSSYSTADYLQLHYVNQLYYYDSTAGLIPVEATIAKRVKAIEDTYVTLGTEQTITGAKSFTQAITLSGTTAAARRIYFGDSSHYLELDSNGFHFYGAGLYADTWVAAGGYGSGNGGGGGGSISYLNDLTDVTAPNPSTNDLLRWNGSAWVNVPQSSIVPTISVVVPSTGNALTGVTASGATLTFTTGTFLVASDLNGYATESWVGSHYVASVTVTQELESGTKVASIAVNGGTPVDIYAPTVTRESITNLIADSTTITGLYADRATKDGDGNVISSTYATVTAMQTAVANVNTLEYITAPQQDGKMEFTWKNGDTVIVDLNHEHSQYVPITRTINGVDLSQNRTFYVGTSPIQGTATAQHLTGILSIKATSAETSQLVWNSTYGAWQVKGNLYADGWVAGGGIGGGSGSIGSLYSLAEVNVNTQTLTSGQVLVYNGSSWSNSSLLVDTTLSSSSNNAIANSTVYTALQGKQATLTAGTGISIVNNVISATGGGSSVSVSNLLSSGTRVATITINGTGYDILAPTSGGSGSGETDPVFTASAAYGITATDISNWNSMVSGIALNNQVYTPTNGIAFLGTLVSTVTIASGTGRGTLKITVNGVTTDNIAVTGLGDLAFMNNIRSSDVDLSSDYMTLYSDQEVDGDKQFNDLITALGNIEVADIYPVSDGSGSVGYSNKRFANAFVQTISTGQINLKNSTTGNDSAQITAASGYLRLRTGANVGSSYKDVTFSEANGLYPEQSGINLGNIGSTNRWACVYGVNTDLSGNLVMATTSHIDIGPLRIEYDATNKALHITKVSSNDTEEYGLYADCFISCGGVGSSSQAS